MAVSIRDSGLLEAVGGAGAFFADSDPVELTDFSQGVWHSHRVAIEEEQPRGLASGQWLAIAGTGVDLSAARSDAPERFEDQQLNHILNAYGLGTIRRIAVWILEEPKRRAGDQYAVVLTFELRRDRPGIVHAMAFLGHAGGRGRLDDMDLPWQLRLDLRWPSILDASLEAAEGARGEWQRYEFQARRRVWSRDHDEDLRIVMGTFAHATLFSVSTQDGGEPVLVIWPARRTEPERLFVATQNIASPLRPTKVGTAMSVRLSGRVIQPVGDRICWQVFDADGYPIVVVATSLDSLDAGISVVESAMALR